VLDGGTGAYDRLSYRLRTVGVRVDLNRRRSNGRTGERDLVTGIEDLTGGRGDDRLAGTDGQNSLRGRRGRHRLVGRGSADTLDPGPQRDVVACGAGADHVPRFVTSFDFFEPGCERVEAYAGTDSHIVLDTHPAWSRPDPLTFRLDCGWYEPGDDHEECSGTYRLHEAAGKRRLVASGGFPAGRWSQHPVTVRLTRTGRQLAARPGGLVVAVSLTGDFAYPFRWRIRLRLDR
jgi:Ca2+-binding RTX toxin-like protein